MSGQQVVDLYKSLRGRADQYPDQGFDVSGRSNQSLAQAHKDLAASIKNDAASYLSSTGRGKLAQDWNDAIVYRAKSGAYEQALDGAGNVRVPELKRQLFKADVPLSDNAEMMAHIGASDPELFRGTPAAPRPGLMRRATAATLPAAGAAVGASLAGAPGAVAGEFLGKHFGDKLLRP